MSFIFFFCSDQHYTYTTHNCPNAYLKNNQVPECPLCNAPVPIGRGQQPDAAVSAHIDNDCQSDPAKSRRKVFTNKCSKKGCKVKEVIPVICNDCRANYCLKHRHPSDHNCPKTVIIPPKQTRYESYFVARIYIFSVRNFSISKVF